jgi:plasmid maintenance system antidote protein VapI
MRTNRNVAESRNVRAEMVRHNIKAADLSKVLDISTVSVSNKLTGKTSWTLAEAKRIVDLFNSLGSNYTVESLFFTGASEMSELRAR